MSNNPQSTQSSAKNNKISIDPALATIVVAIITIIGSIITSTITSSITSERGEQRGRQTAMAEVNQTIEVMRTEISSLTNKDPITETRFVTVTQLVTSPPVEITVVQTVEVPVTVIATDEGVQDQPQQQATPTPPLVVYAEGDIAEQNGAELSLLKADIGVNEVGFIWRVANRTNQDLPFQFTGSDFRYTSELSQTLAVTQILCPGGIVCNDVSIRLKPGETFEYFNRVRVNTTCGVKEIKVVVRNISHLKISNWTIPVPGC